jgi:hypothetical protein
VTRKAVYRGRWRCTALLQFGLVIALPGALCAQPITETSLAGALAQQAAARARLQEAERRLAQVRADAQREGEATATRIRIETAPLARQLEALEAAPTRTVPPVDEPERLRELNLRFAERESALALLVGIQERAIAELRRIEAEAERAASAVLRAEETSRLAAETAQRAEQVRARLAGPTALQDREIRDAAWPEIPQPAWDEAGQVLGDALIVLIAAIQRAPVEPDREGRYILRDLPGGRWWIAGVAHDRRDILDMWELTVVRDGLVVLGRPLELDLDRLSQVDGPGRASSGYDACLMENLRGVASDAAATAIIGACRTRHPAEARFDVTLEVVSRRRPPLLLMLTATEAREMAAIIRRYLAVLEPALETAARRIASQRLQDAEAALAVDVAAARRAEADAARRREEADQASSQVASARAAVERAAREVTEFRAQRDTDELNAEAARLRTELDRRRADAATRIEAERERLRDDITTARSNLQQAELRIRTADDPRRQRAAQAEAAAMAEVEAAQRAVSASDAEVPRLRRALAERWRDDYLRERVAASVAVAPIPYSSNGDHVLCLFIANSGELALVRPRATIRFRGRTMTEIGISPSLFGVSSIESPSITYPNRFDEPITGLRPRGNWGTRYGQREYEQGCIRLSPSTARAGDTGRAFERVGGFSTSQQDWSVSVSAELSRPDDLRETTPSFRGSRSWEHVASSPETIFASRLAAVRPLQQQPPTSQPSLPGVAPVGPVSALTDRPTQGTSTTAPSIGVADAQRRLRDLGLYRGAVDGLMGPGTRSAIRSFERDRGLPETGDLAGRTAEVLLTMP